MSLSRYLITALVAARALHATVHLVFPFEVLEYTNEGVQGCDARQLKNPLCVFSASAFAQAAVFEFGWSIVLYNWAGSQRLRVLLFAVMNLMIMAVDSWSAHGADITLSTSLEAEFSEKLAFASVVAAMLVFRAPESYREVIPEDPSLMTQVNEMWFLVCCFLKLLVSAAAMNDPIQAAMLKTVDSWKASEVFSVARIVALSGAHGTALALCLAFVPTQDKAGLQPYMLLTASQVFAYMIDASILARMPPAMQFANVLGGHAFIISMLFVGMFLLFLTWREDGYRIQGGASSRAERKAENKQE
jgi:hypothetical protein